MHESVFEVELGEEELVRGWYGDRESEPGDD
jgi:hypothetical protein